MMSTGGRRHAAKLNSTESENSFTVYQSFQVVVINVTVIKSMDSLFLVSHTRVLAKAKKDDWSCHQLLN